MKDEKTDNNWTPYFCLSPFHRPLLRACVRVCAFVLCCRYGYGVGVRVDSPVGPLRLEYAWNDKKVGRFHFGIGYHG